MMSNTRLLFLVSALIVAAVIALLWPRVQDCFFTKGQYCVCDGFRDNFGNCEVRR